jgi:SNF2 family DNA or RNA helicase
MKLLDVQLAALEKCALRRKFAYLLEPGCGKTLLSLFEYDKLYQAGVVDVMIIVCPNSLIANWRAEVTKHGFSFDTVVKPDGLIQVKPGTVVLYNYESLIAKAGELIPKILKTHRGYVVFDESVQVKNFRSSRWKAINGWRNNITFTRILSGRPMVQSVMDLWSQLTLVGAEINSSPYAFRNQYAIMGGWQGKVVTGARNMECLQAKMDTVSFVAKKKDWLGIPDKTYTTRQYEMTAEQAKLYKQMKNDMVATLGDDTVSVMQKVHAINKLQQIGSGFMIGEDEKALPIMPFAQVPKLKILEEIIEETPNKIIIFAHYRSSVQALHDHLGGALITGGMSEEEIKHNSDMFNNDPDCRVMVAQLAAAKYGHTWLGNEDMRCHTTVYFENSYSLDARIQSEDRNHRIGQQNPVLYVDMVGSPIEQRIIKLLQDKNELSLAVMEKAINEGIR